MFAGCYRPLILLLVPVLLAGTNLERHQVYHVSGRDSFQIGSRELRSDSSYDGSETLTIRTEDGSVRYIADAAYDKTDGGVVQRETASFVSIIGPDGREHDESGKDPEFLTILNQPFNVQLDKDTLADVRELSEPSPFSFASSMAGSMLRGTLRRIPDGVIGGRRVVGIGFDAAGPMRGGIPAHREITLTGTIRMTGRAYYTTREALLLELDATLEIVGTLSDESTSDPVKIVYRRTMRAE